MREIRLEFPGGASDDDLRGLYNRLNREPELHGRADLVRGPSPDGTLNGGGWEAIVLKIAEDLSSGLLTASVVAAIKAAVDWAGGKPQPEAQEPMTVGTSDADSAAVTVDLGTLVTLLTARQEAEIQSAAARVTAGMGDAGDGGAGETMSTVNTRPSVSLAMPGSRAVLIGTGWHSPNAAGLRDVPAVGNGVSKLADLLTDRCGMGADRVKPLHDRNDVSEVKQRLTTEAGKATDVLFVYYAGHGLIGHDGELYLSLSSTNREDPDATALPFASVAKRLAASPARAIVVVLDCCYAAGALTSGGGLYQGITVPKGIAGGYILAAAARDSVAMVPKGARYTAFTSEFLDYLEQGDPAGGEDLTMGSAGQYLRSVLVRKGFPEPDWGSNRIGDQIILAGNPQSAQRTRTGPVPARVPVPAPVPDAEAEPEMSQGTVPLKKNLDEPGLVAQGANTTIADPGPAQRDMGYRVPEEAPVSRRQDQQWQDKGSTRPAPDVRAPSRGPGTPQGNGGPGPTAPEPPAAKEPEPGRWRKFAVGGGVLALIIVLILIFTVFNQGTTSTHNPGPGPAPTGTAVRECAPGTVNLVGSTAFGPIASGAVAAYLSKCHHRAGLTVSMDPQDSASGVSWLEAGEIGSRKVDPRSMIAMYDGADSSVPSSYPSGSVGAVGFVVIANKALVGSPALAGGSLSTQELQKIFVSGEPGKVAVGRPAGSGSRKALLYGALGLQSGEQFPVTSRSCNSLPSTVTTCTESSTSEVLKYVNELPNGIGYVAYEDYLKNKGTYKNLRVLQIDQAALGPEEVRDGSYKFWATEHLYTRSDSSSSVRGFLKFLSGYLGTEPQDGFFSCAVLPKGTKNGC